MIVIQLTTIEIVNTIEVIIKTNLGKVVQKLWISIINTKISTNTCEIVQGIEKDT